MQSSDSNNANTTDEIQIPDADFPDSVTFINKSYKTFSLLDLQDALIAFTKSRTETKAKIDKIIPKNFVKFVSCKGLMERIKQDYKDKYLLEANSDKEMSLVVQKFDNLIKKHNIQLEENNKSDKKRSLVYPIREVKEILRSSMLNFECFISTLKDQEEAVKRYGDRFKNELMKEIKPEISTFLENLYDRIAINQNKFEETCRLVDMYMYVLNFGEVVNNQEKRTMLVNTMLVRFKEETFSSLKMSDEYYSFLFKSLLKILEQTDESQSIEAIHHVFSCFKNVLISTDPKYSKIVFRRIDDFRKSCKVNQYCIKELKNENSHLKIEVFKHFIQLATIPEAIEIFDQLIDVFKESEIKTVQQIISLKVEKHLNESTLKGFQYIEESYKVLKMVSRCLGHAESKNIKTLEKNTRDRKGQEIQEISKKFSKLFIKENEDVKILMEATKIVDKGGKDTFKILSDCKEKISTRPVVLYYLHVFLKIESPILSKTEKENVELLKHQFNHLIEECN